MKSRRKEAIGLDVGLHRMKIVHLRRRGKSFRVMRADQVRVPESNRELVQMLGHYVREHGLERIPFVIGLSGDSHMLRVFEENRSNGATGRDAVIREQLASLPGAGDGTCSDYTVLHKNRGRRWVLFSMMRNLSAELVLDLATEAGLGDVVGLVPSPIGTFNAIAQLHRPSPALFAVIEINPGNSGIMLGSGHTLLSYHRFHIQLFAGKEQEENPLFDEWLAEVQTCLEMSQDALPVGEVRPSVLYLCGDITLDNQQVERLESATGMRCAVGNEAASGAGFLDLKHLHAAFGLALGAIRKAPVWIDLLPEQQQIRMALRKQLACWVMIGTCAVSASVILFSSMFGECKRLESTVRKQQQLLEYRQSHEQELIDLRKRKAQLLLQLKPLRTADGNGRALRTVLALLGQAKHDTEWLTLLADDRSYRPDGPASSGDSASDAFALRRIVAEGYTSSAELARVRSMIDALRADPAVKAADLLADDKVHRNPDRDKEWAFADGELFSLEIEVAIP